MDVVDMGEVEKVDMGRWFSGWRWRTWGSGHHFGNGGLGQGGHHGRDGGYSNGGGQVDGKWW